ALSLLTVAATASPKPNAWPSHRHSQGPDGHWNKVYWYPGGGYGFDPMGTAFDSTRGQLVRLAHDLVTFESVANPQQSRIVSVRDWAGIPVACSAIYDPRRDRIVVLTLDSLSYRVGVFGLSLHDPVRWNRLVPFGSSPNLSYATAIYDPEADRMIVYG